MPGAHPILSESASQSLPAFRESNPHSTWLLFLASFFALYSELVIIRYLSTEVRIFAYLKNLPLIASFLGLGVGMTLGRLPSGLKRVFPFVAALLFLVIGYAPTLHLTHVPFPNADYFVWGLGNQGVRPMLEALQYLGTVLAMTALVVAFFMVPGAIVGHYLALLPALRGYGVNLVGSLTGIAAFTAISFLALPPVVWILVAFLAAVPFFFKDRMALVVFLLTVLAMAAPHPDNYWSPYYHIILKTIPSPPGWLQPPAYVLTVNHDFHQRMVNLSPDFVSRYPDFEPNRSALPTYELPYRLARDPREVLIVGAGTGNDVAAALRNGAAHIDAVEIDPVILGLGRKYHPERPYDSPLVTQHLGDARAYFKKARELGKAYDLIVFGFLDSHTLLTSFSSLRLDNYVYTLESFQEARSLLRVGGTLVLGFSSGRSFVTDRLFATLARTFGVPPHVYLAGHDDLVFVEGQAREVPVVMNLPEISEKLKSRASGTLVATDRWPFLYLAKRAVPVSILWVLVLFCLGSLVFLRRMQTLPHLKSRESLHFLFLGAGFLLLETKAVTELSLLFGSTWTVNAMVIGTFLVAGLLANSVVMLRPVSGRIAYAALFALLGLGLVIPCAWLDGFSTPLKLLGAAALVGLPVFFSGLVFSGSFASVARPSEALGANLLGAVAGGALENTVMVGGTAFLGFLAILLYALSAVCATRRASGVRLQPLSSVLRIPDAQPPAPR